MLYFIILLIISHSWLYNKGKPFKTSKDRARFLVMVLIPFLGTLYHWYQRPNFKQRYELKKGNVSF